jgi:hypothetical protein
MFRLIQSHHQVLCCVWQYSDLKLQAVLSHRRLELGTSQTQVLQPELLWAVTTWLTLSLYIWSSIRLVKALTCCQHELLKSNLWSSSVWSLASVLRWLAGKKQNVVSLENTFHLRCHVLLHPSSGLLLWPKHNADNYLPHCTESHRRIHASVETSNEWHNLVSLATIPGIFNWLFKFDLLIGLKVCEMLWSLKFFCGIWSQKSEQEAISVIINHVNRGPTGQSRSCGWWFPDVECIS